MSDQVISRLKQIAQDAAKDEGAVIEALAREIDQLEERLAERKAARELARTAVMRGDQFAPELDGNYQCPICWVSNGIHADLTPIPNDTSDSDDLFRCENCNRQIEIEPPH